MLAILRVNLPLTATCEDDQKTRRAAKIINYGAHKGTLSVVIFFISFVRNNISFVRNIISFVRNIISFVRNIISFVRNDFVCTKYYFVCTK